MIKKNEKGFSFVELSVVILVIIIITTMSLPLISRVLKTYRVKVGSESLATKLNAARQTAIRRGGAIMVFLDPTTNRVFIDSNQNGIPEGFLNPNVRNGIATNEEYDLPQGVELDIPGGNNCFRVPSSFSGINIPAPPTELGITNYNNWKAVIYDSRGELDLTYKSNNNQSTNNCITNNMGANPAGAVLVKCKEINGTTVNTISISLRGGVSVLTF
jgi:type II secretory pathway pseudopilin PulG